MYKIDYTKRFQKDVQRCHKRGFDISLLTRVAQLLAADGELPPEYNPHKLSGNYEGCWECHIKPDWLLVWQKNDNLLTLLFLRTGSHSDLF